MYLGIRRKLSHQWGRCLLLATNKVLCASDESPAYIVQRVRIFILDMRNDRRRHVYGVYCQLIRARVIRSSSPIGGLRLHFSLCSWLVHDYYAVYYLGPGWLMNRGPLIDYGYALALIKLNGAAF